jgi:CRP-like cAMP-binding protein
MIYIVKSGEFEQLRVRKISTENSKLPIKAKTKQRIRLTLICRGQMFGEEDIINNRRATTTAVCISTFAVVYCIKADEFLNKMSN